MPKERTPLHVWASEQKAEFHACPASNSKTRWYWWVTWSTNKFAKGSAPTLNLALNQLYQIHK